MSMFGKRTNAQTTPKLGGVPVQTSVLGMTLAAHYGRTQVSGNLIWYNGFKSTPITERRTGKGGGGSQVTGYNYSAWIILALGEGLITGVRRAWRGKDVFEGTSQASRTQSITEQRTVPANGIVVLANAASVVALGQVTANLGYDLGDQPLSVGVDFTVSGGTLTFDLSWALKQVTILAEVQTTVDASSALQWLGLVLRTGALGQTPMPQITSSYPTKALSYSGVAYLFGQDIPLGEGASVENYKFEVDAGFQYSTTIPDADPRAVVGDILSNPRYGVDFSSAHMQQPSLTKYSQYCVANGLFVSPSYTSQRAAREVIQDLLEATNTVVGWTGSQLRFIPRGDEAVTGNGVTYTPDNVVAFDVTPDDLTKPIAVERMSAEVRHNQITVEYRNRANGYAVEPVVRRDDAAIIREGINAEDALSWDFFCDAGPASQAAQLRLQSKQAARARYQCSASWRLLDLQVGDLVRLQDPVVGVDDVIAMVLSIQYELDGGKLLITFTAEDFPIGNASAPVTPNQLGSGFSPQQNIDPGSIATPRFLEPPGGLTATGLEVLVAAAGQSQWWGGCDVWTSLDNASFVRVGRIELGCRYGSLSANLAAGGGSTATVQLVGQGGSLPDASLADAQTQRTLCFVGNTASGEYLSYIDATLIAANQYTLTGLQRAQNGTQDAARSSGDGFVFVDTAMGRSGPLDRSLIGRPIYFKFPSFNVFGGGGQSLASVPAYSYTPTGRFIDQLGQPVTLANIGVGTAGNLLRNSGWSNSFVGWGDNTFSTGDPYSIDIATAGEAVAHVPRNIRFLQIGSSAGQIVRLQSDPVPISGSQRYAFAVDGIGQSATVRAFVNCFDSAGAAVSTTTIVSAAPGAGNPAVPQDYQRMGAFFVAPSNARSARLYLEKMGTSAGGSSKGFFRSPMLALAGPGQTDLPQWNTGAEGGALASFDRATVFAQSANAVATDVAGFNTATQVVHSLDFTLLEPGSVDLTASVDCSDVYVTGGTSVAGAYTAIANLIFAIVDVNTGAIVDDLGLIAFGTQFIVTVGGGARSGAGGFGQSKTVQKQLSAGTYRVRILSAVSGYLQNNTANTTAAITGLRFTRRSLSVSGGFR